MTGSSEDNRLEWLGTVPYAARFGDVYYSVDDPQGEVRHTFLDGTGFTDLCHKDRLCVAETGFGTGLNFLEAWETWSRNAGPDAYMTFLSVEAFPLSRADLRRAHDAFPDHRQRSEELIAAWPGAVPGIHRIRLAQGRIRLILLIGDAAAMLAAMSFQADAWFLDGFAPSRNPDMWRPEVLAQVARNSAPGARLASFTAAGEVRRGLSAQGFVVEKRPGFGRKRDCITAVFTGTPHRNEPGWCQRPNALPRDARIAVIGDGIAGRAMCRALRDAGRSPTQIAGADSRAYAASTLPRALIAPKLIRGDQPFATFWRQAFWDAVRELDNLENGAAWIGPRGLRIAEDGPEGAAKLHRLKEWLAWPEDCLSTVARNDAMPDGLFLPHAGSVDPDTLLSLLGPPADIQADIAALRRDGTTWVLVGNEDRIHFQADAVILACGPGAFPLLPPTPGGFGMRIGSGQCIMMRGLGGPDTAVLENGYVTSADRVGRFTIGATAAPRAKLAPVDIRDDWTADLMDRHRRSLEASKAVVETVWTGLRCDTGDHLPLAGPIQDPVKFGRDFAGLADGKLPNEMPDAGYLPGLYATTALGARGFQAALLLADLVASLVDGDAVPVSDQVLAALAPSRFQLRHIKRGR
ncbi:tRNA (5-methylaminomethyl-2-thiouridine)(34)-methyltransferase MnmD [Pacificispira sp.]|uniref:tRNA (5-methylaminomethyl-2-thiouridine)(34)-methyltransferase MnmD n=1 Tax=Pacificispira sp. TaxID=2888761 RepID=UPI003BA8CC04